MSVDYVLTDEFVEFSQKIAEIHKKKKSKQEELKKLYADFKSQEVSLDKEAEKLCKDFEAWKVEQAKGKK